MKHRKKMLQYAQDAQVSDTPWEWWERASKGEEDWETLDDTPSWYAFARYRRKPQWVIDGKFKIGDLVTFADTPEVRGLGQSRRIGQVYTVIGFIGRRKANYYVQFKNDNSITYCSYTQSCIVPAPKFKVGDRVQYKGVGSGLTIGVFVDENCARLKSGDTLLDGVVRVEYLNFAPQRLEALSKAVGFDVPMPLQEAPADGTEVFIPILSTEPHYFRKVWKGGSCDTREFKDNMIHLTAENAEIHAKALAAISSPHFCP